MRTRSSQLPACAMVGLFLLSAGCGELSSKDDPRSRGALEGEVPDAAGAALAPVAFLISGREAPLATRVASDGHFAFDAVPAGEYSLVINDLLGRGHLAQVAVNGEGDNTLGAQPLDLLEEYQGITELHDVAYEEKLTDTGGELTRLRRAPDDSAMYAWHDKPWLSDFMPEILRIDPQTGETRVEIPGDATHGLTDIGITRGQAITPDGRYLLTDRFYDYYEDGELVQGGMPNLVARDRSSGREVVLEVSNGTFRGFSVKSKVRHILNPHGNTTLPSWRTGASYRDGRIDMLCQESDTYKDGNTWETPVATELVLVGCDLSAETSADGYCQGTVHEVTGPEHDFGFLDYVWSDTHLVVVLDWGDVYAIDRATGERRLLEVVPTPLDGCQDTGCVKDYEVIDEVVWHLSTDRSGHVFYVAAPLETQWGRPTSITVHRADLDTGAVDTVLDFAAHPDLAAGLTEMNLGNTALVPVQQGPAIAVADDGRHIGFAMRLDDGLHVLRLDIETDAIADSGAVSTIELPDGPIEACAPWPVGQNPDHRMTNSCVSGLLRSLEFDAQGNLQAMLVAYPLGPTFVGVTVPADGSPAVVTKFGTDGRYSRDLDRLVDHSTSGRRIGRAVDVEGGHWQLFAFDTEGGAAIPLTFISADHGVGTGEPGPFLDAAEEYLYYLTRDPDSGHDQLYRVNVQQILDLWSGQPAG